MLSVTEIYPAICGESRFIGTPCALVRLSGCHLRCSWCDSAHAFAEGPPYSVPALRERIGALGLPTVLVTGGEPLLQPDVLELLAGLLSDRNTVLLETSGTLGPANMIPLAEVPAGVHRIVDIKAPGSGIGGEAIDWEGIAGLTGADELKIVCADRADYEWARDLLRTGRPLPAGVDVTLSPAHGCLQPSALAEWILADRLAVHFQIQLHKAVWPGREQGV